MQSSRALRLAIVTLSRWGVVNGKPIVREEPASEAPRFRLRTMFSALLANDDVKQARFIFTHKLKQGDIEEASRLIAGQMRRGTICTQQK